MVKQYLPAILVVLIILGFFGFIIYKDQQTATDQYKQSAAQTTAKTDPAPSPDPSENNNDSMKNVKEPAMTIDESKTYTAILHTDKGDVTIALNAKQTPVTVNNFVYLAKQKFYENTIFHRVIKGFMIQGGDPTGTGAGGPGYRFDDEPFEGSYDRGTVAMANAGPDTNGSQFFIMHAKQDLPPNYTIFGKVTEGLETVDAIATAEVTQSDSGEPSKPVTPAKIKTVEIIEQ